MSTPDANGIAAIYKRPTGFSDPEFYAEPVSIVGYCFGTSQDGDGYDRRGETVLAIFIDKHGNFRSAPLRYFGVTLATQKGDHPDADR